MKVPGVIAEAGADGRQRRAVSRRLGWALSDQLLSSAANFAVLVAVARLTSARGFGVFSLVMATYIVAVSMGRGLAGEPLITRHSARQANDVYDAIRRSVPTALATGSVLAVGLALVAVFLPAGMRPSFLVLAAALPGLLMQDHVRYAYFALAQPRRAFLNDGLWAVLQAVLIGCVVLVLSRSVSSLVGAWGLAGSLAGLVGVVTLGVVPKLRAAGAWLRTHRDLWIYYLADNLLFQATTLTVYAVVAMASGLASVAGMRAAVAAYAPLTVLGLGAVSAGVPEMSRLVQKRPARLYLAACASGGILFLLAIACVGVALRLPEPVGLWLFGASWSLAQPLLLLAGADVAFGMLSLGAFIGIRASGFGAGSLTARSLVAVMRLIAAPFGAFYGGAMGALLALACLAPLQTSVWFWQLRTRLRVTGSSR